LSDSALNSGQLAKFVLGAGNGKPHLSTVLPPIHTDAQHRFEESGKKLAAEELAKRDKSGLGM